jgi:fructose-bisphosphate aldolase class II
MPLVNGNKLLQYAKQEQFAVGAFNAENMEMVQAIVEAAQEERSPVILQVSQWTIQYAGLAMAAGIVKVAAAQVDVPVVLHLDHGADYTQNIQCLHQGFTSLMIDGSHLPFEENVALTRNVVEAAQAVSIPVEAELGVVLKIGARPEEVEASLTDPVLAGEFVRRTGCASLAVAVGSVHAMRASEAELDIDRLRLIQDRTGCPLVLHGGSGIRHDHLQAAIRAGVCKVNIGTYLKQGFTDAVRHGMEESPGEIDFRKFLAPAREVVKARAREKMQLFGSSDRINKDGSFR